MHEESVYLQQWYADQYDSEKFGQSFGSYLQAREVGLYLSLLDPSYQVVLDVGAGTGKLALPMLGQSRRVISVDASAEMLRVAKAKAHQQDLELRGLVGDAHRLAFKDRQFDCVVSSRVLMHLADWKQGIAELCRVSRVAVVLDFPPVASSGGLGSLARRVKKLFVPDTRAYQAFSIASVVKELELNNFAVVEMRKGYFLPVGLHRWIDRPLLSARVEKLCQALGLVRLLGAPVTLKAVAKTLE